MPAITGYGGNPNLSYRYDQHSYTKEQLSEIIKCMDPVTGPVYFITNYMKIISVDKGLVPFDLYPFQIDMVNNINKNRYTICKVARQSGKSTTVIAYLLWYILFKENMKVAILANKGATSRELLSRVQLAYEHIPRWLQQGLVIWNKGFLELANGSSILAEATSSGSVRGRTFNVVLLDEFAHVDTNLAHDFFQSTFPVISSGMTTKCIIVSTPKGMNYFHKMWVDAEKGDNDFKTIDVHWTAVPGRDIKWKEDMIRQTSEQQFEQEFEVNFLGSANTLISAKKLKDMVWLKPIETEIVLGDESFVIFEKPHPKGIYVITCDVSHGQGMDFQAFNVIDVTNIPYKQVARFSNNKVSPLEYPSIIYNVATKYNNAHVLVEINDIGQQVVDILHYDFSYENLIKLTVKNKQGQNVSAGFKKQVQFGIRTTSAVKKIGCANLKTLIENDKLIINDYYTIAELTNFVSTKESFAAAPGEHDDITMSLVLFGWLANQRLFKDTIGSDIRRSLGDENIDTMAQEPVFAGIIDQGDVVKMERDSAGDLWMEEVKSSFPYSDFNNDWNSNF